MLSDCASFLCFLLLLFLLFYCFVSCLLLSICNTFFLFQNSLVFFLLSSFSQIFSYSVAYCAYSASLFAPGVCACSAASMPFWSASWSTRSSPKRFAPWKKINERPWLPNWLTILHDPTQILRLFNTFPSPFWRFARKDCKGKTQTSNQKAILVTVISDVTKRLFSNVFGALWVTKHLF